MPVRRTSTPNKLLIPTSIDLNLEENDNSTSNNNALAISTSETSKPVSRIDDVEISPGKNNLFNVRCFFLVLYDIILL